jgi:hypothetical protein
MVRESKAPVPSTPNHLSRRLLHCPSSAAHDANKKRSCVFDCEYDKEYIQSNETHVYAWWQACFTLQPRISGSTLSGSTL